MLIFFDKNSFVLQSGTRRLITKIMYCKLHLPSHQKQLTIADKLYETMIFKTLNTQEIA